jgi:hypothetical protein
MAHHRAKAQLAARHLDPVEAGDAADAEQAGR